MSSRYDNIARLSAPKRGTYLAPVLYPEVPLNDNDLYVITTEGDRYDTLSVQFYGRMDYWWIIMAANPSNIAGDSLAIMPGTQLRIPAEPEDYLVLYQHLNS